MTAIDITNTVSLLLSLIIAIISTFLVPFIKSKATNEELNTIKFWVNIAVKAAEMIYEGTGRGAEKKEYVVGFLESKGFDIDMDEIDKIIEAAVLELKIATETTAIN